MVRSLPASMTDGQKSSPSVNPLICCATGDTAGLAVAVTVSRAAV